MSIGRRVIQLAKIGLGARRLGKSQGEEERRLAKRALAGLFADTRGTAMKFGQLLAEHSGDDPFADLVTSVEPLPLADILAVLEAEWGRPWDDVLDSIEESQAAASLGQVHKATLKDGTQVAIKVRYPGIADAVAAEMTLAGLIPGAGPMKKWGFDLGGYKRILKNNMDRELDYRSEADRQNRFRDRVRVPGLVVPRVRMGLTTERVLVQDWEDGVRLNQVSEWPEADREGVGRILLATLFVSLFEAGEIHGDPHLGNTSYRLNDQGKPEVVLMDYGCTLPIEENARLALMKLLLALREGAAVSWFALYQAMGFDLKKLSHIGEHLPRISRVLLQPLLGDGVFSVSAWQLRQRFEEILGESRWWFRSSGPASSVLLLRAFQGAVQQLDQIDVRLDWWRILSASVSPAMIEKARAFIPPAVPDAFVRQEPVPVAENQAKYLKVDVREGFRQVVYITMPAAAALDLENLMPEDVIRHIHDSGEIDLEETLARVRDSGLCPQDILKIDKGEKTYRVWLE